MITLFGKAETAVREELPQDPALARLFFLSRHLEDLQSVSLVGIPAAFLELPLLDQVNFHAKVIVMAATVTLGAAWYFFCRWWYRVRYGRSWRDQAAGPAGGATWSFPVIIGFTVFQALIFWSEVFTPNHSPHHTVSNAAALTVWSMWLGQITRDHTNLPLRRTIYMAAAGAFVASLLCFMYALSIPSRGLQLDSLAAIGGVQLFLALFDAWLLHHTFAQTQQDTKQAA